MNTQRAKAAFAMELDSFTEHLTPKEKMFAAILSKNLAAMFLSLGDGFANQGMTQIEVYRVLEASIAQCLKCASGNVANNEIRNKES